MGKCFLFRIGIFRYNTWAVFISSSIIYSSWALTLPCKVSLVHLQSTSNIRFTVDRPRNIAVDFEQGVWFRLDQAEEPMCCFSGDEPDGAPGLKLWSATVSLASPNGSSSFTTLAQGSVFIVKSFFS